MSKRFNHKWIALGGLALWAWVFVGATASGATLAELIARLKQQKEQETLGRVPNASPSPAIKEAIEARLPSAPLLWSISGLDDDLQAVLVYQGKAYVARANGPRIRMGPWWIESISPHRVLLNAHDKPAALPLVLEAPQRGAAIEPYAMSLGLYRTVNAISPTASAQPPTARAQQSGEFSPLWPPGEPMLLGTLPSDPSSGPLPSNLKPGPVSKRP